jgi:hypothetical protein
MVIFSIFTISPANQKSFELLLNFTLCVAAIGSKLVAKLCGCSFYFAATQHFGCKNVARKLANKSAWRILL